jgi:hypothetical protein
MQFVFQWWQKQMTVIVGVQFVFQWWQKQMTVIVGVQFVFQWWQKQMTVIVGMQFVFQWWQKQMTVILWNLCDCNSATGLKIHSRNIMLQTRMDCEECVKIISCPHSDMVQGKKTSNKILKTIQLYKGNW